MNADDIGPILLLCGFLLFISSCGGLIGFEVAQYGPKYELHKLHAVYHQNMGFQVECSYCAMKARKPFKLKTKNKSTDGLATGMIVGSMISRR